MFPHLLNGRRGIRNGNSLPPSLRTLNNARPLDERVQTDLNYPLARHLGARAEIHTPGTQGMRVKMGPWREKQREMTNLEKRCKCVVFGGCVRRGEEKVSEGYKEYEK